MYNSKTINQRIAILLKSKPFNQRQLLENCELNINLLNKMTDNKGIGCFALAKIADHLETSTDYLLGRTDIPDMVVESDILPPPTLRLEAGASRSSTATCTVSAS